jgi:hypothetical protein
VIAEVGAGSQRTHVDIQNGSTVDSASITVTSGNLMVVWGSAWKGITAVTVTDTRSTSYSTILGSGLSDGAGGQYRPFLAYGIVPTSGACVVTIAPSGDPGMWMNAVIDEFSGVSASPLSVNGGSSTGTGSPMSDGITTLTAGELVVAVVGMGAGTGDFSMTPAAGWTQVEEVESTAIACYSAIFQVVGAAGAYTPSWTSGANRAWSVTSASFKAPTSAAVQLKSMLSLLGVGT